MEENRKVACEWKSENQKKFWSSLQSNSETKELQLKVP